MTKELRISHPFSTTVNYCQVSPGLCDSHAIYRCFWMGRGTWGSFSLNPTAGGAQELLLEAYRQRNQLQEALRYPAEGDLKNTALHSAARHNHRGDMPSAADVG